MTQRAAHGAFILEPHDVKAVLANLIADWATRTGVVIHAAVFMNNHFHLSATPPSASALSMMIGKATQLVSRYINSKQPKGGPNWQSRFYAAPMDPEHAVATARYIERNPVAAGLVQEPWLWPWSTAAFHAGLGKRPKLLTEGTTILGLVPMLWATGVGAEVIRPMAAPVLGGILIADEVIDLLIPVLFYWVRRGRWQAMQQSSSPTGDDSTTLSASNSSERNLETCHVV